MLVDTSMWVEFFSLRPRASAASIAQLRADILEDRAVIVEPIRAELLSGHIRQAQRTTIVRALAAMRSIDLDWNAREHWNEIIALATTATKHRLAIPGVVDRMILLAAQKAGATICTLDKSLTALASVVGVALR